jgi:hypothetical protein
LIVTVLIGQIGNFAGLSTLQPPANVTALLKCGQIGNRLCPEPWVGANASVDPQGFRFPCGNSNWPGRVPGAGRQACGAWSSARAPVRHGVEPVPAGTYRLDFLAAAGTLVFLASLLAFRADADLRRAPPARSATTLGKDRPATAPSRDHDRVHPSRIAPVMNYSGMTSSMALALAKTGVLFPVFLGLARHDRCVPHRQRHLVEYALRPAAGNDREAVRAGSGPDGRHQQFGGRDGEDDQPAEPVGRRRGRRRRRGARGRSWRR